MKRIKKVILISALLTAHLTHTGKPLSLSLLEAVKTGNVTVVQQALRLPANKRMINAPDVRGATPLIRAAMQDDVDSAKALAHVPGVDPNMQDNSGMTALMYAAHNGSLAMVQVLTKIRGIDLNIQNNKGDGSGMTAWDYAKSPSCLRYLENLGAASGARVTP